MYYIHESLKYVWCPLNTKVCMVSMKQKVCMVAMKHKSVYGSNETQKSVYGIHDTQKCVHDICGTQTCSWCLWNMYPWITKCNVYVSMF